MQKPKRILFVDDSPTQRALWIHFLAAEGIRVAGADDDAEPAPGESVELLVSPSPVEALEAAVANAIDVLVTDIDMPELSGWQLIERLLPEIAGLRVVVISSQVETGDAPKAGSPEQVKVFNKSDRGLAQSALLGMLGRDA